jgi:3',5'-cyclic AMP phosphodiesterase CpdA
MRTILHISDLHFGRVDVPLLRPLTAIAHGLEPHLVVVSGDLTQRARTAELKAARAFLDTLPGPRIVVPGNHDVPLHNVFARFFQGLGKYRRYITDDLEPFYSDDEIAVLGINTARSLTIKGGRISAEQIETLRRRMCALPPQVVKIVVTHHPFDLPETAAHGIVGRADLAMQAMADCDVDAVLSGHLHLSHTTHSAHRFRYDGHSALIVQAGTATSTRGRGEVNSFNVLRVEPGRISVELVAWHPETVSFATKSVERFYKSGREWRRQL